MEAAAGEAGNQPGRNLTAGALGGVDLFFAATAGLPRTAGAAIDESRAALGWVSIFLLPWLVEVLVLFVLIFLGLKELYLDNATFAPTSCSTTPASSSGRSAPTPRARRSGRSRRPASGVCTRTAEAVTVLSQSRFRGTASSPRELEPSASPICTSSACRAAIVS